MNESLLQELLSLPTAPFREEAVSQWLEGQLRKYDIPYFKDHFKNIVIGFRSEKLLKQALSKRTSSNPMRMFIAHMDHPGFHGVQWRNAKRLHAKWFGGSPIEGVKNAQVWASGTKVIETVGRIARYSVHSSKHGIDTLDIVFSDERLYRKYKDRPGQIAGGFSFKSSVWKVGQKYFTKAADDLVGCFSILSLAIELWSNLKHKTQRPCFVGLLSRAEEVGFVGAVAHFNQMKYGSSANILAVSLETSRELPGARIGYGPIVRLGDRNSVFDPNALRVLTSIAEKKLPRRFQKRIMDGGSCEATAALAFGVRSIGISVPLGNYHNQRFKPLTAASKTLVDAKSLSGAAPECVDFRDVLGMFELIRELMKNKLNWKTPWSPLNKALIKRLQNYKRLASR